MRNWYVAVTKFRSEFTAEKELRAQAFITYLPKFFRHPTDDGWIKQPHGLRFPNYVFVEFDPDVDAYGAINHTRGIAENGLQLTNGLPQALRRGYVKVLMGFENEDLERAIAWGRADVRQDLRAGDEVQVSDPEHRAHGMIGRYLETEHDTAWVLIGPARIPIPQANLRKIEKAKSKKAKAKKGARAALKTAA